MSQHNDFRENTPNLHPERRRRISNQPQQKQETEIAISPFFAPSRNRETDENDRDGDNDDNDDGEIETSPGHRVRKRQAVLSINGGKLTTRRGLINPQSHNDPRRAPLRAVAEQTMAYLPGLLATRPDISNDGFLCKSSLLILNPTHCPNLPRTRIRVLNSDTIDAALSLTVKPGGKPVAILNMANATSAGGGFRHGALAQEEALCYRTSLYRTLKLRYYPLGTTEGIYSPQILVIRSSLKTGHGLLDLREPARLPVLSAISVAAVCRPDVSTDAAGNETYKNSSDERTMVAKISLMLRMAAVNGHTQIVLGAFGCGAFGNPRSVVAGLFESVLLEPEFAGGWWEDVVFAVMEDRGGNYATFKAKLEGVRV